MSGVGWVWCRINIPLDAGDEIKLFHYIVLLKPDPYSKISWYCHAHVVIIVDPYFPSRSCPFHGVVMRMKFSCTGKHPYLLSWSFSCHDHVMR